MISKIIITCPTCGHPVQFTPDAVFKAGQIGLELLTMPCKKCIDVDALLQHPYLLDRLMSDVLRQKGL